MRRIGICCCAAILLGCGKKSDDSGMPRSEAPASDTGAAASAPAPAAPQAPAPISMADLQGKWKMRTMAEGSDSALVEYEVDIGPSGLTVHLPKRPPIKGTAVVAGDSMVSDAGPYESVLRKGVKVTTHSVFRLENGKLVGTLVGHYATKGPDSVKTLHTEGTKE